MLDIRQTGNYAGYLKNQGWTIEKINGIYYFLRKLPVVGCILKVQRPETIDFEVIDKLCRKYRVFQVVLEPKSSTADIHNSLIKHDYRLSKSTYLPSKTLQIDLTQSKEEILAHFKKDARQAIRKSLGSDHGGERVFESNHEPRVYDPERPEGVEGGQGIIIRQYSTPNQIKKFREAWKNSVKFTRYVPGEAQLINLRKSFPQNKSLFLASHNISGSIIGGLIFTTSSHDRSNYITYYWSAFTSKLGRTSLSQYSLLYYGILWAKKQGYKVFDFEGIYDDRFPNRSWLGFTHFKKSFGGVELLYPGCYTKFRLPF